MSKNALLRSNCKLREHANNEWRIIVDAGTPPERVCDSEYHATVAGDYLPFDKLFLIWADSSRYMELLVLACGKGYARLEVLLDKALPAIVVSQQGLPPNHEIVHLGPDVDQMYAVRRMSDGVFLGKGFTSREAALDHLLAHASLA